ncbi:hypothetical protein FPV67DRAFT_884124 [Lyophyllum atratum]|nr:hypothetical protein FPV67DRAFT_884124 [Lyophyllum atratum]
MNLCSTMTHEEREHAIFLLGPWLVGTLLDIFLQGALCSQFISYFTWHHNDGIGTRLAVVGLALMTTLKAIHSIALVWIMFILHFKDLDGAILLNYTVWWQIGNPLIVATIGVYVQVFFCRRVWVISKKNIWYVLPIGTVLLLAYLSICLATYYISLGAAAGKLIAMWFAVHLSSVFAGDLMITVVTAYLLLKSRKDVLPQTVGILRALVRLTFQTAAPAALCAMFNLIFSQVYSGDDRLISTAFNQALPKLYAFSMMWTLNARRKIRKNSGFQTSEIGNSRSDSAGRRMDDVELSAYGNTFQVHTRTEVTQHVDFKDVSETKDPLVDLKRKE